MEGLHYRKRSRQNNKNQVRKDFVTTVFSKELVLNVFSFLSSRDLIQCAAVSTEWYRLANDEMVITFFSINICYSSLYLYCITVMETVVLQALS